MDWPANPLWDDSVALYRRPGVEAACLELQRRYGLDVNLVLFCCWLGRAGIVLEPALLTAALATTSGWQAEVVRPLRALRNRLKAKLVDPDSDSVVEGWPGLAGEVRRRALDLELDAERLGQLALHRVVEGHRPGESPGPELAFRNLCRYWSFDERDRHALGVVLDAAFPETPSTELSARLATLGPS